MARLIELARGAEVNVLLVICDKGHALCTTYESCDSAIVAEQLTQQLFDRTEVLTGRDVLPLPSVKRIVQLAVPV